MICLDTDFLIALWRSRGNPEHPARKVLARHPGEVLVVCVPAAGEFLEGAALVSEERLRDAVQFLHLFEVSGLTLQTAVQYARTVADLRRRSLLAGASKVDVWIAAWALQHNALLATQNVKHFRQVPGLKLVSA
jgi:predicted nucleic acid-binding protein